MTVRILIGDVREKLRELADESVHCACTSPPYWRQRDYKIGGQIGLETTPEAYIANLLEVFREVHRVLRSDGTLWINIGDSYCSSPKGNPGVRGNINGGKRDSAEADAGAALSKRNLSGIKPKDLLLIPFMLATALRSEGWYLRQCNVWAKPNGMPESVNDRTTVAHEYVLHLSKSPSYYYDAEAVRTPPAPSTELRLAQDIENQQGSHRANGGTRPDRPFKVPRRSEKQRGHSRRHAGFNDRWDAMSPEEQRANGANLRSVWWISPAQYRGGHYAVMPEKLAEICIKAGTSEKGCCGECGKPWVRITEKGEPVQQHWAPGTQEKIDKAQGEHGASSVFNTGFTTPKITVGWGPSCRCGGGIIAPCTVLDPFAGVGTTGLVADRHQRHAILIELNPEYAAEAQARIRGDAPMLVEMSA